jgi:DNA-directed RNA polymerase specialized sigma24 family protein
VPAELAGQRPLLQRAAAGDREAFGLLYDGQVEGVYRYLLAWTGDRAAAGELTRQVFTGAMGWLPVTAGGGGEAGAWLIAMARDAVAQRRGSGRIAGDAGVGPGTAAAQDPPGDVVAAVARLGDPEREVVVLRLLLGHSLDHTAHLSGYRHRAALELQLAACLAVWRLAGGAGAGPAPATGMASAEEFERRLDRREVDLTGGDPVLAGALAVAGSLRRASPGYRAGPDDAFVARLRHELVAGAAVDGDAHPPPAAGTVPLRGWLLRRPWVATAVATFGIVVVLGLQAFGGPGPGCEGRPCPAATSVAVAAGAASSLGTPLTTVVEPTTTSSTVPSQTTRQPASRTSAATSPPTTGPETTATPTTRASRPTTTRAPTTTAPTTTTAAPTTTTSAPAPT